MVTYIVRRFLYSIPVLFAASVLIFFSVTVVGDPLATLKQNPGADLEGQGWHLHEYVEVAAHLKLIEGDTAKLVRLTKDFRNLIHPGRAARLGQKCDRSTALTALAAVEAVARDLTP